MYFKRNRRTVSSAGPWESAGLSPVEEVSPVCGLPFTHHSSRELWVGYSELIK